MNTPLMSEGNTGLATTTDLKNLITLNRFGHTVVFINVSEEKTSANLFSIAAAAKALS